MIETLLYTISNSDVTIAEYLAQKLDTKQGQQTESMKMPSNTFRMTSLFRGGGACFIVGMGNSIKQITKIIRIIIKEMMKYF